MLKKLYYRLFPTYRILETIFVTYRVGNQLIEDTENSPEEERWVLAKEEDNNPIIGMVYLCRKVRITA